MREEREEGRGVGVWEGVEKGGYKKKSSVL